MADKVTVRTRAAGENQKTASSGNRLAKVNHTVADITKEDRGTEITLHLREGEDEFLDDWRAFHHQQIFRPYRAAGRDRKTRRERRRNRYLPREKINKAQALWTRNKSEITDEEYKEFYKHIAHDFNDPLTRSHNRVEGKQEYTSLLYIPSRHRGICGTAIINTV